MLLPSVYVGDCGWVFENEAVEEHFTELHRAEFRADFAECARFLNMRLRHDPKQRTVTIDQAEYGDAVIFDAVKALRVSLHSGLLAYHIVRSESGECCGSLP